jgi:hypothetical protein
VSIYVSDAFAGKLFSFKALFMICDIFYFCSKKILEIMKNLKLISFHSMCSECYAKKMPVSKFVSNEVRFMYSQNKKII